MRGLDTYIGRPVTAISSDSEGNWFIELVGGVRVINTDPDFPPPDLGAIDPTSLVFAAVIMGESQTQMSLARMNQGVMMDEWRATFSPTKYQIYDSEQQDTAWSPQVGTPVVEVPPYPAERDVSGRSELGAEGTASDEPPPTEAKETSTEGTTKSTSKKSGTKKSSTSKRKSK
jgi:hypothetical protein